MSVTPDIIHLSPNFNDAPIVGRTVIIHGTRSGKSMNPSEFIGTLNYMEQKYTTSSQWVISRKGEKARVVPNNKQAHHAGVDNDNTWGVELEQGAEQDGFTQLELNALVEVCRDEYMADYDVPPVRVLSSSAPGFVGHQDTQQGRASGKSDPGVLFPWEWFINELKKQPDQGGSDMMIPANGVAQWFSDRIGPRRYNGPEDGREFDEMLIRADFQDSLPQEAKMVRLDVGLKSGSMKWNHGSPNGLIAGVIEDGETHAIIDILIGDDGRVLFNGAAEIRFVGILGYWV